MLECGLDCDVNSNTNARTQVPTKESIQKYLQDASVEILVLVEGYDPSTSCNVQRNKSYTSNDIMWNHKFVPCVSRTNREVVVDMNAFHKTMKLT